MSQSLKSLLLFGTLSLTICAIFLVWHNQAGFMPTDKEHWLWLVKTYFPNKTNYPYDLSRSALYVIVAGMAIIVGEVIILSRASTSTLVGGRKVRDTHGSARWATLKDIKKKGLLKPSGLVIGGLKKGRSVKALYYQGKEHILAFCPTGSGKGVSLVLPTLLQWPDSVFVLDIKGENFSKSAGYRKQLGHNVLLLQPGNPDNSVAYNPLDQIRIGTDHEVSDCQALATMVVDPDGKGTEGDFWKTSSYEWLWVCLLHVCHKIRQEQGRNANFHDLYNFMNTNGIMATLQKNDDEESSDESKEKQSEEIFNALTQSMIDFKHGTDNANQTIHGLALSMRDMAHQTRTGIHKNASAPLGLFGDPHLAKVSASSSFTMDDLVNQENPTALYLWIEPKDILRLKPYTRIVFTQLLDKLCTKMDHSKGKEAHGKKHRILLMLDEFTSLGKVEKFETALPYLRSYGIQSYCVVQDIKQLVKYYGRDHSIFSNSDIRITFTASDDETAEKISKLCGKTTLIQRKMSASSGNKSIGGGSESLSEVARPLLTADEVLRLQKLDTTLDPALPGEVVTLIQGSDPILGEQALYFKDKALLKRSRIAPPQMSALARPASLQRQGSEKKPEQIPHDPETGEVLED